MAVPLTWIGRVCGVSASRAPSVTTSSTPSSSAQASSSAQNWRHFMFGSMPAQQHDVAVRAGRAGDVHLGGGPGDPAHALVGGADQGPVDLEVVELLGIDRRDHLRAPHLDQVVDHAGGGARPRRSTPRTPRSSPGRGQRGARRRSRSPSSLDRAAPRGGAAAMSAGRNRSGAACDRCHHATWSRAEGVPPSLAAGRPRTTNRSPV